MIWVTIKRGYLLAVVLWMVCISPSVLTVDSSDEIPKASRREIQPAKTWEKAKAEAEKRWFQMERDQHDNWTRLKTQVESKWQKFIHSTKKEWVDYGPQKDVRSRVDFEKGKIVLETVIPEKEKNAFKKARGKIEKQARKLFGSKNIIKKDILEDQVVNREGGKVNRKNYERYIKDEISPIIKSDYPVLQSRDGIKRKKYLAEIYMVPDHIKVRAIQYLPIVRTNAKRFQLNPRLIMAIIHTESFFNPMAVSDRGAIGIMQIIPQFAGREAYHFLHNRDQILNSEYLYNPKNNIEMGCAYLHLLKYRYFKDVSSDLKNRYISICGYNWGPTSMRKKILDKYPIDKMNDNETYKLLRQKTPYETRKYIKKVTQRIPLYDSFLNIVKNN